jgi:hypothetical protein
VHLEPQSRDLAKSEQDVSGDFDDVPELTMRQLKIEAS